MRVLPGDPRAEDDVNAMIRVDHAGEYGALRIYAGQLAVLRGQGRSRELIEHMMGQEKRHLEAFEGIARARNVRPTALMPLWHVAGFALGAATALLGEKAAFACTAAVESVIDAHYAAQHKKLGAGESELAETIARFREEEIEHRETSLKEGAEEAPFYPVLSTAIKGASKLAIWLSTRI